MDQDASTSGPDPSETQQHLHVQPARSTTAPPQHRAASRPARAVIAPRIQADNIGHRVRLEAVHLAAPCHSPKAVKSVLLPKQMSERRCLGSCWRSSGGGKGKAWE